MSSRDQINSGQLSASELRLLKGLYTSGKAAFGSKKNLIKESGLSRKKVELFLHSRNSYTKFHQPTRKFRRMRVFAKHINEIWCMDLAQMDKLASDNSDVKFLLVCVDVASRYVRVQPMKQKTASVCKQAFSKMIGNSPNPDKIWVDQGTEFQGQFKAFCNDLGIKLYNNNSETKACFAERAIRSLKNIIYRYMDEFNTPKYLGKLQSIVKTMNKRTNRSIGKSPAEFTNRDIINQIYGDLNETKPPSFSVGQYVRISHKQIQFQKGYKPQFTHEIFQINKIFRTNPVTYQLKDRSGELIKGKFYGQELIWYNESS